MTTQQPLSEKLRQLLKDQPSLRAVAQKAGVAQPSLSRFLNGERDLKFNTVAKVLDVLGYDLCRSTSTDNP